MWLAVTALHPPRGSTPVALTGSNAPCVHFINPLEVDGFAEPGGWGTTSAAEKPILYFFPGMDGSLQTPFMQFCELSTTFELACMRHNEGLASRASFEEVADSCAVAVATSAAGGRQVLLVGESFGATLALAVADKLSRVLLPGQQRGGVRGVVLVNPATSYRRSTLAKIGPLCASLAGPLLAPLYALSLVAVAALVLTPAYQVPSFLSTVAAQKATELNNNPYREAFVGRVAMGATLGLSGPRLDIGPLLAIQVFSPEELGFRLSRWLEYGADLIERRSVVKELRLPMLAVVGDLDRLLPSVDEAARLREACDPAFWRGLSVSRGTSWTPPRHGRDTREAPSRRGTVTVQGAGHASTLGNRVDLLDEIRNAFATDFEPPLSPRVDLVGRGESPGDGGDGWERGLLDRTYPALDPADYTELNRGGSRYPSSEEGEGEEEEEAPPRAQQPRVSGPQMSASVEPRTANVDALISLLADCRPASARAPAERAAIRELLCALEEAGEGVAYLDAAGDAPLCGNYELAYFDRSIDGKCGSGGEEPTRPFGSRALGALFSLRFSFQHLVAPDAAINYVGFTCCGIPASVFTAGAVERLDRPAVEALRRQHGTPLRFDTAVRVDFGTPRLSIGRGGWARTFELPAGQSPPVSLCTTYVDERLRLARAAGGGRLVFTRGGLADEPLADSWRAVADQTPVRPRSVAAVALGILASLAAAVPPLRRPLQLAALVGGAGAAVRVADSRRRARRGWATMGRREPVGGGD